DRRQYSLAGVIYNRDTHFTARYVDPTEHVWFNDGMVTGRSATLEGKIRDVDMMSDPSEKARDVFVYVRDRA
ncbi:hypothetical protein ARMSODRAFT_898711, partial [Armillaria solidipes]